MDYVLVCVIGVLGGGFAVWVAVEAKRKLLNELKQRQDVQKEKNKADWQLIATTKEELVHQSAKLSLERDEFRAKTISYQQLQDENVILKRDLRNLDINVRKIHLDCELQRKAQAKLDERSQELGSRYLKENVKWIIASLGPNNFTNSKQRLNDAIERCREIGLPISENEEKSLMANLRAEYEKAVRAAFEREEQARIRAQIREEQLRQKEVERELAQLAREKDAIKAALDRALAEAAGQHSAEVEQLEARLAEAEAKAQRAISQAQLTKAGHVYVISNIGSFGEGVFKVGMTRRLEPIERINELSTASVPFPYDVHMMISCDNAPTLETALHRALFKSRINRTNPRKEFFKTDIETIFRIVKDHHGEVQYVADAEALQYRQSLAMPDEDQEYIESVYDQLGDEEELVADEA